MKPDDKGSTIIRQLAAIYHSTTHQTTQDFNRIQVHGPFTAHYTCH